MFEARSGVDLRDDESAMKRVREAAERAWREHLVLADSGIEVNLPFITATAQGPLHLEERLGVSQVKRVFAGDGFSAARSESRRLDP